MKNQSIFGCVATSFQCPVSKSTNTDKLIAHCQQNGDQRGAMEMRSLLSRNTRWYTHFHCPNTSKISCICSTSKPYPKFIPPPATGLDTLDRYQKLAALLPWWWLYTITTATPTHPQNMWTWIYFPAILFNSCIQLYFHLIPNLDFIAWKQARRPNYSLVSLPQCLNCPHCSSHAQMTHLHLMVKSVTFAKLT